MSEEFKKLKPVGEALDFEGNESNLLRFRLKQVLEDVEGDSIGCLSENQAGVINQALDKDSLGVLNIAAHVITISKATKNCFRCLTEECPERNPDSPKTTQEVLDQAMMETVGEKDGGLYWESIHHLYPPSR